MKIEPSAVGAPAQAPQKSRKERKLRRELEDFNTCGPSHAFRYHRERTFRQVLPGLQAVDKNFVYPIPARPAPGWVPRLLRPAAGGVRTWWDHLHTQTMALRPLSGQGAPATLDLAHVPAILSGMMASWLDERVAYLGMRLYAAALHTAPGAPHMVHVQGALPVDAAGTVRAIRPAAKRNEVLPADVGLDMTYTVYEQAFLKLAGAQYDADGPLLLMPPPWIDGDDAATLRTDVLEASMAAITGNLPQTLSFREAAPSPVALVPPRGAAAVVIFRHPSGLAGEIRSANAVVRRAPYETPALSLHTMTRHADGSVTENPQEHLILSGVPYSVAAHDQQTMTLRSPFARAMANWYADPQSSLARADLWQDFGGPLHIDALDARQQPADLGRVLGQALHEFSLPLTVLSPMVESITAVPRPTVQAAQTAALQRGWARAVTQGARLFRTAQGNRLADTLPEAVHMVSPHVLTKQPTHFINQPLIDPNAAVTDVASLHLDALLLGAAHRINTHGAPGHDRLNQLIWGKSLPLTHEHMHRCLQSMPDLRYPFGADLESRAAVTWRTLDLLTGDPSIQRARGEDLTDAASLAQLQSTLARPNSLSVISFKPPAQAVSINGIVAQPITWPQPGVSLSIENSSAFGQPLLAHVPYAVLNANDSAVKLDLTVVNDAVQVSLREAAKLVYVATPLSLGNRAWQHTPAGAPFSRFFWRPNSVNWVNVPLEVLPHILEHVQSAVLPTPGAVAPQQAARYGWMASCLPPRAILDTLAEAPAVRNSDAAPAG